MILLNTRDGNPISGSEGPCDKQTGEPVKSKAIIGEQWIFET